MQPKLLDHAKQSAKNALKTTSKKVIQKAPEATGGLIDKIELKNSEKFQNRIIQKQLQMSTIKKYLKKDTYLHMKDKKLLMV